MLLSEPVLPSLSVYPEHLFPKAFCAIAHPSELAVLSATGWERRPEMLTHATLISPRHYPQTCARKHNSSNDVRKLEARF